ncbi:CU044_5270 family protein [Streptomyces sp. NPDC093568]|uniref:CU044_5270 family protein n=1 Tax=Streptomyces sp. NPDC093568 TaxID=3366041 RepID=UPI00380C9865
MNTNSRRRGQPDDYQDLADLLPAPGRPVLSQDRHHVLRERLMEQITPETTHQQSAARSAAPNSPETSPGHPMRRRPGRRLVLVAAPMALVAVVGLGVVVVDRAQDGTGTTDVSATEHRQAAQLLDRIALVAADRPAVTVGDDQYIYTKSQGSSAIWGGPTTPLRDAKGDIIGLKTYKGDVQSQEWAAVNGKRAGLRRLVALSPEGELDPSKTQDIEMQGAAYLSFRQLQALPTDPDALLKKLEDGSGVEESRLTETVFENVGVLLDQATLLPDLSAALYRAVAKLPGVHVVENAKDGAGRPGIGLTYTSSKSSTAGANGYWVFDEKSLAYLGTTKSALLEAGVADRKGEAPDSAA